MRNYRVGVIGRTGRGNYGHRLDMVWKTVPQTQVVAVADDNPAGLKDAYGDRLTFYGGMPAASVAQPMSEAAQYTSPGSTP